MHVYMFMWLHAHLRILTSVDVGHPDLAEVFGLKLE